MRARALIVAAVLLVGGCGSSVDPATVDLTGSWSAAPDALGIGTLTLDLVEANGTLSVSGTYIAATNLAPNGTVGGNGIHLSGSVNMNLTFTPEGGDPVSQNFSGHVDDEDHFVLVFPTEEAKRVTFTRR